MLQENSSQLKSWFGKLPDDLQAQLQDDFTDENPAFDAVAPKIAEADVPDFKTILEEQADLVEQMGRAARIRLLSHVVAKTYPHLVNEFRELIGENEGEGDGERTKIQVLFLEDIKVFKEIVAKRTFTAATTFDTAIVQTAAIENIDVLRPPRP